MKRIISCPCPSQEQSPEMFCEKDVQKNSAIFTGKPCVGVSKTQTQVLSYENCEITKNIYFEKQLRITASASQVFRRVSEFISY